MTLKIGNYTVMVSAEYTLPSCREGIEKDTRSFLVHIAAILYNASRFEESEGFPAIAGGLMNEFWDINRTLNEEEVM